MTRLTIRIDLRPDAAFGPGKARLLELVDRTGSIRKAAAGMEMSYRRAWLLLRDIDRVIGAPALETRTGGTRGGGASLTTQGRAMLERYRAIERRAAESVSTDLARLARSTSRTRGRRGKE